MAPDERAPGLPEGTVTFLLTDVDRPDELVDTVVAAHGGVRADDQGDEAVAVFASAAAAVAAALEVQRAYGTARRVRVALDTGEAHLTGGRTYTGTAVHRGASLRDVAHGGQTLLSSVTASIVADALPGGAWLADLGAHRLHDLSRPERIFDLRHADLAAGDGDSDSEGFPPLRSLDVLANNLPAQLTSFVGRGEELAAVERLLSGERLVTLTGSGGCGKTRLAVQAAAGLADGWPDGVWWVDLAPVTDPARVAELAAATIKVMVEPVGGPLRALTLHLRDRRLLVCLDNCEHLLDAAAELGEALLRSCPEVTVLATSREPLGVAGETVWRVPSMVDDEAVSLFTERAAHVRPGFTVGAANDAAVRTVCQRLDGIPLALELAAAWVRVLTPIEIAVGLDHRFQLLTGGSRGAVARQQTLAASVAWSYDLLDDDERTVLRQLAVFPGGFTLDAAHAVCAGPRADQDVLLTLGRLVDKSLVLADQSDGQARYRLLETIRQYAHQRLEEAGEAGATRDRHLDYFLSLAEAAEPELEQADQDQWLARLETEHDNLRTALNWSLSVAERSERGRRHHGAAGGGRAGLSAPDPGRGRRLAAALPRLWLLHAHTHEGLDYLHRAIGAAPNERSTLQARLLVAAAQLAATCGDFGLIVDATHRGLEIATAIGDDRNRGRCLDLEAYIHVYVDFPAARELCDEARRHAEAAGDDYGTDLSLVLEGLALTNGDRHEDARPVLEAAFQRSWQRGDRILAAFALTGQMEGCLRTGDLRRADELGTEAVRVAEPLGDYFTVGSVTSNLAWVKGAVGDIAAGLRLTETVVRSVEGAPYGVDSPTMAVCRGQLHLWDGDLESARRWFERAARYAEPFLDNLIVARALPGLATVHRRLGEPDTAREHADRAVALARKLDIPHVLAEALDETAILVAADDPGRAEGLHHEALAVRVGGGLRTFYADSLDALARHAARAESFTEAARLYAASDAARHEMGYPRPPVNRWDHDTAVVALRSPLGDTGFGTAWSEGATLSLDDAVAYATRARGARGRPTTGWASLTPTELKVVALAVEGLTNPDIAGRLFMSRDTVKTHLSHVYAKLDVTNRTELATLASARLLGSRA